MDGTGFGGQMTPPLTYDYRLYDRIWQRVSPELTPYPQVRERDGESTQSAAGKGGEILPGEQRDPCCMGSGAKDDLAVLEGFLTQELAARRCYLSLAGSVCRRDVQQLLRRMGEEKLSAARELRAAIFLIAGTPAQPKVAVEPMRWRSLADALRSCYHQEACDGFNYLRAVDGTADPCLQKLLRRLGEAAWRRADEVMSQLGLIIEKNGQ